MSLKRFMATTTLVLIPLMAACSSGKASSSAPTTAASPGTTTEPPSTTAPTTTSPAADAPEVNPSGDIPDNQAFVEIAVPAAGFALKVPEGWARTDANATISFNDKLNEITVQSVASPAAPTIASAQSQEVPAVAAGAARYEPGKVATVARPAGPAVLITYRADAPADPVTGKVVHDDVERYEFWRNGTEAVLTLSSPVGADNVDPWKTVTGSFRWT